MRRRIALATLLCLPILAARAATLPGGFTETTIASGLSNATAMALAPDGRIFVAQESGAVRVIRNNTLLTTPFVTVTTTTAGERGLLGIALDPDFLNNGYVYVYYTVPGSPAHNRISRFTAAGDVAAANSEAILFELDNLSSDFHNGGAIHFGLDGKLYAGVGENGVGSNSQSLNNVLGKLLRISRDGTIPADNPFYGSATGNNRAIWARGLRNPFTFGIHPSTGKIHINDVGSTLYEEINLGAAGGNYGWPNEEGPSDPPNPAYIDPIHYYSLAGSECAITGGAFYSPDVRQFPGTYLESYFFGDICAGWIRRLDESNQMSGFATGVTQPIDFVVGHDGSLYYLTHLGLVVRVRWSQHLEGDVNGDGSVTAADVFYFINYLHGGGPALASGTGDVDGSGQVNADDLAYLATYVYGRGPAPVQV